MVAALAGLLVAFASPPIDSRVELTWRAPTACPDATAIRERLQEFAPEPPPGPPVRVRADVERRAGTWRLRLALRGPGLDDRRVVEAQDCRTLADVTALLSALAIAPTEVTAQLAPATTSAPPPAGGLTSIPAPPEAPVRATDPRTDVPEPPGAPSGATARALEPLQDAPSRADAPPFPPGVAAIDDPLREPPPPGAFAQAADPVAPPKPRAPVRGAVRVGGGGEIGGIPAWSPSVGLAVAVFRAAWRVEIAGTYAARGLTYADPAEVGGRVLLAGGAVRGCGVPRWRRLEFPICGGLELGLVRAVGRGVTDPRPASDLWIAAQLSPGLAWVPTRVLAVTLTLDVLVALRRPGFHVASLGDLARSQPVGLRPMLGLEVRFP